MIEKRDADFSALDIIHDIEVERLVSMIERYLPVLRVKRVFSVHFFQQCPAVLKEACKRLRKRHPELKVKRVKECGESFIRVSRKTD